MNIRTLTESDRSWAAEVVAQHFCTPEVVSRGVRHDTRCLPGLVVEDAQARLGLVHYCIVGTRCEVVALVVLKRRQGLGRRLLEALESVARARDCSCLWLVTTNDNRAAQACFAALGWRLVGVHRGAVAVARRQKPEIPERAADGTRIEDELEYELGFADAGQETYSEGRSKNARSGRYVWLWSLAGFGLGILSSGAYLLLGGDYFWNIPRYARLLFYPGFVAGAGAYQLGLSESLSKLVGVLVVGVAYGLTAFLLAFACRIDAALREGSHQNLGP